MNCCKIIAQNNNGLGFEMARQMKCPECEQATYCVTTKSEAKLITTRYYTCSNLPQCGAQFVMIESFSHFTHRPAKEDAMAKIKDLFSTMTKEQQKAFSSELSAS